MATYYFASTGNDTTGDGSQVNPWATENHALTGDRLSDGDVLIGLDTITATRTIMATGGDATIQTAEGAELELPASSTTYLYNPDSHVITFDGVKFSDPNSASGYDLFQPYADRSLVLTDCDFATVNGLNLVNLVSGDPTVRIEDTTIDNLNVCNVTNGTGYDVSIDGCTITDCKVARWQGAAAGTGAIAITNNVITGSEDSTVFQGSYNGDVDVVITGNVVKFASTDKNKTFLFPNNTLLGSGTSSLDCKNNVFWFSDGDQETILSSAVNYVFDSLYASWRHYYLDPDSTNGKTALAGGIPAWGVTHKLVGIGDSIMVGAGVATTAEKWWSVFNAATGYGLVVDNTTAINGLTMDGCLLNIDRAFSEHAPGYCFVAIGVNGSGELFDGTYTAEQYANGIIRCLTKIHEYQAYPYWLGMEYTDTNATHMGSIDDVNGYVESWCTAHGYPYANIAATMLERRPADWDTYYYDDASGIDGDVHPGVEGHKLISELALDTFQRTRSIIREIRASAIVCRPIECVPVGFPELP